MQEQWETQRTNNCRPLEAGRKLRKYAKVDMTAYREQQDFAEFYNEGVVLTLPEFLASRGFDPTDFSSEARMKAFIEKDTCRLY